jgi:hypothetical protein
LEGPSLGRAAAAGEALTQALLNGPPGRRAKHLPRVVRQPAVTTPDEPLAHDWIAVEQSSERSTAT